MPLETWGMSLCGCKQPTVNHPAHELTLSVPLADLLEPLDMPSLSCTMDRETGWFGGRFALELRIRRFDWGEGVSVRGPG
jgi:hypothetical protein